MPCKRTVGDGVGGGEGRLDLLLVSVKPVPIPLVDRAHDGDDRDGHQRQPPLKDQHVAHDEADTDRRLDGEAEHPGQIVRLPKPDVI